MAYDFCILSKQVKFWLNTRRSSVLHNIACNLGKGKLWSLGEKLGSLGGKLPYSYEPKSSESSSHGDWDTETEN